MIINYSHRFTFVHAPKTAGSSVGQFLAPLLGPKDLQLGSWHETIASGVPFNRRVYVDGLHPSVFFKTVSRLIRWRDPVVVWDQSQKKRFVSLLGHVPQHATAERIQAFDPASWHAHFKFAFVRNPFARMVSNYNWDKKNRKKAGADWMTFSQYVRRLHELDQSAQPYRKISDFYCINGKIALDFIARFEQMEEGLKTIVGELRLPLDTSNFPHAKPGKSIDYRCYYGQEDRKLVEDLSRWEIETFEYRF